MEQDGIYRGRRNGSRVRDWYVHALHEGDEEEANQASRMLKKSASFVLDTREA